MERGWIGVGLQVILIVALLAMVVGQLLGQPVLLGFVETGSMEPTLEAGDGFVAIPSVVASDPEPGDVVVFDAQEIEGGGLTTHRIVDETDRGYITQGDANPFTDQDSSEPPVQDAQIVATVAQPTGSVLAIPHLGTAVMAVNGGFDRVQTWIATTLGFRSVQGTTGIAYILLGISLGAYALETLRERRQKQVQSRLGRESAFDVDPRLLCVGFALMVMVASMGAMIVPAGTQSFDVVSAQSPSDRPLVIEQGTSEELEYQTANSGLVPVVVMLEPESEGVATADETLFVDRRGEAETNVTLTAPPETGAYQLYLGEYRYLHVLPASVLERLAALNPWLPVLVITALLGGATYVIGRLLIGEDPIRTKRTDGRREKLSQRTHFER
ncbi:signal peptidase I [Natrialbaceae archaeon A-CW3]